MSLTSLISISLGAILLRTMSWSSFSAFVLPRRVQKDGHCSRDEFCSNFRNDTCLSSYISGKRISASSSQP